MLFAYLFPLSCALASVHNEYKVALMHQYSDISLLYILMHVFAIHMNHLAGVVSLFSKDEESCVETTILAHHGHGSKV